MPTYHDFRDSPRGRTMIELARKATALMQALSAEGKPAVAAIDAAVADVLGPLDNTERQHGGRIVRDQLAPLGWRPEPVRKRLRGGRAFTSGAVYSPMHRTSVTAEAGAATASWRDTVLARADEAIAMLAAARTGRAGSVDDFIAERRAEAERDER